MAGEPRILAINPGSTSTKLGVFAGNVAETVAEIAHDPEHLALYRKISAQEGYRYGLVEEFLERAGGGLDAAVGRGGILRPLPGGVYKIDAVMLRDLREARFGSHASNLGAPIAHRVAARRGIPAFIADPPVVDELDDVSRVTGHPLVKRRSIFHALNQKEAARRYAAQTGGKYERLVLVVCHLGGGISVGVHRNGRVAWVNSALDGEGPFAPERSGGLPAAGVLELALSGKYSADDLRRMIAGAGGLMAHLGTSDLRRVLALKTRRSGLVIEALALSVAREISAAVGFIGGLPDAVIITGNMALSEEFTRMVTGRIDKVFNVVVMPGSFELEALAAAAVRVLSGEEEARDYIAL
ncbi:MAG TPA: butyrate kinase [Planctomycetes bacterium]|nr:butyrate kinase [Planctomycetota bacterium]